MKQSKNKAETIVVNQNPGNYPSGKKYCQHCGREIDADCVVCPFCGKQVAEIRTAPDPVVINNNVKAVAKSRVVVRRRHSLLFDLIMIPLTGGLWLIWMIIRGFFGW